MGDIEEDYDCSGICEQKDIYVFSDADRGAPETSCKEGLLDEIDAAIGYFGYGTFALAVIMTVSWILHFPLYCLRGKGNAIPCTRV